MDETSSSQLPGGTITFLFSDIAGSTELLKHLREDYATLLTDQRDLLRTYFNKWNGHVVDTEGDSFFVSFPRATDALQAVVEIQRALMRHFWPDNVEVKIRIGLHTGEPLSVTQEGYIGIAVHRAARIAHLGHGGQTLLSETTTALVRDDLPEGVGLLDLGQHLLKDIDRPEHIHQLVVEGLEAEFPPLESLITANDRQKIRVEQRSTTSAAIVVLPFINISSDEENEYFSDGLTEEIIADLSKVRDLHVISRTSAMMYKGTTKDSKTIGNELNVNYLLEGSVRKANNSLRITAQLIDTLNDTHVWAEKYSGSLEDVFEIQESLSRKIVGALEMELSPQESRLVQKKAVNPAAHQAYLQGRYHLNMATPEGFTKSIQYFEEAISIEPDYALAYAGLASAYNYLGWYGAPANEVYPQAKQAATKALEIDEMVAEAHDQLGYTAFSYDWDWEAAEKHLKRAIELNPNSSEAFLHYHWYLFTLLRAEECHAAIRKAKELDPLSVVIHMNLPNYYELVGEYDTMLQRALNTLETAPFAITAHLNAGWAYLHLGLGEEAVRQFKQLVDFTGPAFKGLLGYAYGAAGDLDNALAILNELGTLREVEYVPAMQFALIYIGLGQVDQAFLWLEKSFEERGSPLIPYIRIFPMFDSIRDDPRYLDLIRRLNFPIQVG